MQDEEEELEDGFRMGGGDEDDPILDDIPEEIFELDEEDPDKDR